MLELASRGYTVSIFSLHYPYTNTPYEWNGIQVYPLNGRNRFSERTFKLFRKLKRKFKFVNNNLKIDVIHSFWLNECSFFAAKIAHKYNLPILASAQGQDVLETNSFLKKIRKLNPLVFTMSIFQEEFLSPYSFTSLETITWGVNSSSVMEKEIDVIAVGNLIPLKNHTYFIQLCGELIKQKPSIKVTLIGQGYELRRLLSLAEELGITSQLSVISELPHTDTIKMIAKSKVLVHTSDFEGFGIVLIEALANCTHVISSPVGFASAAKEIHRLTFDLLKDTEQIHALIHAHPPSPIIHSITKTVDQYITIYESF